MCPLRPPGCPEAARFNTPQATSKVWRDPRLYYAHCDPHRLLICRTIAVRHARVSLHGRHPGAPPPPPPPPRPLTLITQSLRSNDEGRTWSGEPATHPSETREPQFDSSTPAHESTAPAQSLRPEHRRGGVPFNRRAGVH